MVRVSGYNRVPAELRERDQWVCWDEQSGSKAPMNPDGSGGYASVDDMATWGSFDESVETAEENGWGVGFVFSSADPYMAVDIDDCLDGQSDTCDWLPSLEPAFSDAYVERSPSGTGLHVIAEQCRVPEWWRNQHDGDREVAVFDEGKFFTFTGDAVESPSEELGSPDRFEDWLLGVWTEFNDELPEVSATESVGATGDEAPELGVYDLSFVSRSENPAGSRRPHPVHGSETGQNFMVDEGGETWRCWRHDATGNAYHLLGIHYGLVDCGEWNNGELDAETWSDIFETARDEGLIPDDRPRSAMPSGRRIDESAPSEEEPTPAAVEAIAGLGDESLSSLKTTERAHYAWKWIEENDHVTAMQPDGELYAFDPNKGTWEPNGEQRLREFGQALLGRHFSEKTLRELCERAKANNPLLREDFGTEERTVAVENGLLDIEEREVHELRPEDYAVVRLPVEYDPEAGCERWLEFLDEVVPERWHDAVQEFVGYCLLVGELPVHRCLMLVGEGANGKSTFLQTVRALLGDDNVTSHTLQKLASDEHARADLFGAVANIHSDLSSESLGKRSRFKTLVGGDTIQARRLYENHFNFEPTAKLLFAANEVPEADSKDTAFFRRWLIVEFPYHIPRGERDHRLTEKLTSDEELSGILNWALDGLDRLLDQGHFTGEGEPIEKKDRWLSWGDSVASFMSDCVEVQAEDGRRYTASEVYDAYVAYCREKGEEPASQQKVTNELKSEGADYGKHRIDGKVQRGFRGIEFTDEAPKDPSKGGQDRLPTA